MKKQSAADAAFIATVRVQAQRADWNLPIADTVTPFVPVKSAPARK